MCSKTGFAERALHCRMLALPPPEAPDRTTWHAFDPLNQEQIAGFDPEEVNMRLVGVNPNGHGWYGEAPTRAASGVLLFTDKPGFAPNMTPAEVLQAGSFGGGYFRDIASGVTGATYSKVWQELPAEWLQGLDIATQVASNTYNRNLNRYKVDCGAKDGKGDRFGQSFWEGKGWIVEQDPYGWFQWYCRFFQVCFVWVGGFLRVWGGPKWF